MAAPIDMLAAKARARPSDAAAYLVAQANMDESRGSLSGMGMVDGAGLGERDPRMVFAGPCSRWPASRPALSSVDATLVEHVALYVDALITWASGESITQPNRTREAVPATAKVA